MAHAVESSVVSDFLPYQLYEQFDITDPLKISFLLMNRFICLIQMKVNDVDSLYCIVGLLFHFISVKGVNQQHKSFFLQYLLKNNQLPHMSSSSGH